MKFITIQTKTSLPDLTRDAFEIKGAKAAAASQSAQDALREANPHLADLKMVPAGTLVVVPEVPGIKTVPMQSVGEVNNEIIEYLKKALAGAKAFVEESFAEQMKDAEASALLAKSAELVTLAKKTPELKERLLETVEQAEIQAKQVAEDKKARLQALGKLEEDLASLLPD
jgi:phage tail protein X